MNRFYYAAMLVGLIAGSAAAQWHKPQPLDVIRHLEAQRGRFPGRLDADSVHSYDMLELGLDYRVENSAVPMTGFATLTLAGRDTLAEIVMDAEDMTILAVNEWDFAVPFIARNDSLIISRPLIPGDTVTLNIQVSVPVAAGNAVGYHVDWEHVFTFSEPYGARRWFPCFDQPFDKIDRTTIAVNMPEHWSLAANGSLVETSVPAPGRKREVYFHDQPISTYLVSICAGNFAKWFETVNGVEYRYYAFPNDSMPAVYDWERTPEMTAVFEELFGEYPFAEYGMAEAALFNGWGAMEHQTFTTYGYQLIDSLHTYEPVVAHELAHMWFGDALSPVDFRHMWLNEGFATYAAALYYEHAESRQRFLNMMSAAADGYFREDAVFRYAAFNPPPPYLFGRVIYEKSSWVLHMLREQLLGDSLFYAALRNYTTAFHLGNVETQDFAATVSAAAGEDLQWFFDQWIYDAGHPVLEISIEAGVPTPEDVTVTVEQTQAEAPIFRLPVSIDVRTAEGTTTHALWFAAQTQAIVYAAGAPVLEATLSEYQPLLYQGTGAPAAAPRRTRPDLFTLQPAYPNPFNSTAILPFDLSRDAMVAMRVYNIQGQAVYAIPEAHYPAGRHRLEFRAGSNLSSGLYMLAVEAGGSRKLAKAILLR